jgi:formylglycine-generating enzyme required for sulfatase activity
MQKAIDQIRELRALHEEGLLSREEFDARKNGILDGEPQPAPRPGTELGLMAGQELGQPGRRYRLERLLARGGMAEVWQAVDLATEAQLGHSAQVALKILPPQSRGGSHVARLLLEETVRARRLAHDHILRVYDWAEDPATGTVFAIMECLEGEDLAALLAREKRLPLECALGLMAPLADALDYAWKRHALVHRDLKPANVFVTRDGTPKLLDFGIAAQPPGPRSGVQAPGNSGTASYRAPEAGDWQLVPDRSLDVHAAAVMLYEMLEGALPSRRGAAPRHIPAAIAEVLRAGFAADPGQRPASVGELMLRLRQSGGRPAMSAVRPDTAMPAAAVPERPATVVPPTRPAPSIKPAPEPRPPERAQAPTDQAQREARRAALRQRVHELVQREAAAEAQPARARKANTVPLAQTGHQLVNLRAAYAGASGDETAPTQAPQPVPVDAAMPAAPKADELPATPQAPRGRLRDRYLGDDGDGPELVILSPGRFLMGSSEQERQAALDAGARKPWVVREGPRHWVALAREFAIARHPVTVGQWREFALSTRWKASGEVNWAAPGFKQTDEHPVVGVSWNDAQLYVRWLSARTGKRYRLPTEAEWEYACRAGSSAPYSFGETIRPGQANYDCRFGWNGAETGVPRRGTTPAGAYEPNAWGLCDMHGNVWEWVQDVMHDSYEGAPVDGSAWEEGGDQARRVLRGGSWLYHPRYLRSAVRNGFAARLSNDKVGFRVVRELD